MAHPLHQQHEHDQKIERIRAGVDLVLDTLDRLADIAGKCVGPRPVLTLAILTVLMWGVATGHTCAEAESVVSTLLRLINK